MNILCVDFIVFIQYMLAGKTLLDCTNLYFKDKYVRRSKS